jgi:hypothetical protein
MSAVFLRSLDGSQIIGLDATSAVQYSRKVNVSTSTMFNGSKLSDNVHPDLPVIQIEGVISSFKMRDTYPQPAEFRRLLDELVDSYEVLNFFGTDDGAIPDINNCYITDFNLTRDVEHSNSLAVSISIQQLDFSNSISATTITKPAESTDGQMADNPTKAKEGTTTNNTPQVFTVLENINKNLSSATSGEFSLIVN